MYSKNKEVYTIVELAVLAIFSNNQEINFEEYMDIDFKITFENGHNVTVKGWSDEFWAYGLNVDDEDSYKWKAGNTYPVKIKKYYFWL